MPRPQRDRTASIPRARMTSLISATALLLAGAATLAFAQSTPDLKLRGDRFKPLTYDQLTPPQKLMADHVMAGERGAMNGPYNVLLRSPEMGDLAQQFGVYARFHSSVGQKLTEFAILITARSWNSQYVWYAHHRYAVQAGLSPAIIQAVSEGQRPDAMPPEESVVYTFCSELLANKQVSDATFQAAKDKFGERGVVDLMSVMGYYTTVSMMLNVDRYPMPEGAKNELQPIK